MPLMIESKARLSDQPGGKEENPMDERLRKIADHYGYDNQSRQLIEEMAELTQAINKYYRKRAGKELVPENDRELYSSSEWSHITEEIADVYIMLEQIRYLLRVDELELMSDMESKIEREIKRVQN